MANGGGQVEQRPEGFWKPRHAMIGLAILGLIVFVFVRSCGGEAEGDSDNVSERSGKAEDGQQAAATQPVAPGVYGLYPSQHQPVPRPGYAQPAYGYPAPGTYSQQAPAHSQQLSPGQQPMVYGQPPTPTTPAQGYGYQAPVTGGTQYQYPAPDPNNPWSGHVQGYGQAPGYSGAQGSGGQWGQYAPPRPVYQQPQATPRFRPLEEDEPAQRAQPAARPVAPAWPVAPYDRRAGTSYGTTDPGGAVAPPANVPYPGYYGTTPGPYGGYYPGTGWPGYRY